MARAGFEDTPKPLSPNAFAFEFDNELKRLVRSNRVLTIVTIVAHRVTGGSTIDADPVTVRNIAEAVGRKVRGADLIGCTDSGIVWVPIDSRFGHSAIVIERLVSRMESCELPEDVELTIGAASYPVHGTDRAALQSQALARPLKHWRPQPGRHPESSALAIARDLNASHSRTMRPPVRKRR